MGNYIIFGEKIVYVENNVVKKFLYYMRDVKYL